MESFVSHEFVFGMTFVLKNCPNVINFAHKNCLGLAEIIQILFLIRVFKLCWAHDEVFYGMSKPNLF